jgi:rhodanese-related sulfurtransferase/ubiquinone/menaquinone biosynthesis C-methylase UbiE
MRFRGSGPRAREIEPRELSERLTADWSPRVVDVRTSFERRIERIPGSEHVSLARALVEAPAFEGPIVVVCRSGHRAQLVASRAGRPDVVALRGGTQGWIRAGLPVERGNSGGFDRMMGAVDVAGMRGWRRKTARGLHGRALELGAGTGRNTRFVPAGVELIAVEPDLEALRYREAEGRDLGHAVAARGEQLPFRDGVFDSALSTLVLCSVEDQPKVADELLRVLEPGASLFAIDHVVSNNRAVAAFQRWRAPAWYRRTESCRIDRESLNVLREHGFDVQVQRTRLFGVFVLYRATPRAS